MRNGQNHGFKRLLDDTDSPTPSVESNNPCQSVIQTPPGYKQTEVGVIPEDWDAVPLGTVTSDIGDGIHATPVYSSTGEYYFINGNNLRDGYIVVTEETKTVEHSEFKKHRKDLGDSSILMSINGTIGNLALFAGEDVVLGKSAAYLNVKDSVSKLFVYHSLQTEPVKRQSSDGLTGTTIRNLGLGTIRNTTIALPPTKAEQETIAEALSDADALIESLEQLIAKKRDLKQGAMKELLTGKKRLPGFSGEWDEMEIGALCHIEEGEITRGGNTNYLEIGDIDISNKTYGISGKEKLSVPGSVKVPAGTLLISTVRPTRGAITITMETTYVSSAFCRLSIKNYFMFYVVCQNQFLTYLGENSKGGTYPTCRTDDILRYRCSAPRVPAEQAAIAIILSDMDAEIAALEAKLAKVRQLKQGMMHNLLTGRIRLI